MSRKVILSQVLFVAALVFSERGYAQALSHSATAVRSDQITVRSDNMQIVEKKKVAPLGFAPDPLRSLARSLAASPVGGDATQAVLLRAARHGDYLPAISWSLAQGYWGLASILIRANPKPIPAWARLSLALHRHDAAAMGKLLRQPESLPVRDRMQAQMDLGRYHQARRDALQGLQTNPFDRQLRQQYLQAVRDSASYLDLAGSWQSFNGLSLAGSQFRGRISLGDRWSLLFAGDALAQSAAASSQLLQTPAWSSRNLLGLRWQDPRWQAQALLGSYLGQRDVVSAQFALHWQATDSGELSANFDYHGRSLQSPALAVAGMVNSVDLQWAQRAGEWLGNVGLGWRQYEGQDGRALGSDRYGEASLLWRHPLGPWQLQMGPFVDYHHLSRVGSLQGVLAEALQADARTVDLVLPGSYADAGLRLQWGARDPALASTWSPYLALSVYENTRFGLQYQLDAGLSTAVLGPDRLRIGFAQGQGGNGLALNQRLVQIGYRFYF